MFKKMKENKKKGFTLVELIVVLVILAILAALLIPALTGYIDKAKRKSIVAETRQVVMAAQTIVDEKYASAGNGTVTLTADDVAEILKLAEVKGSLTADDITIAATDKWRITKLVYTSADKTRTCTYEPGAKNTTDGDYDVDVK
ncbi:prepilin-type N-terminal cleavage/methylation domain-containing protein [Coprococcus comes]|uniref:prepilin-type N-terminal cleavage/methylation domain-containing protein n=1 Tax=Coprococcus comes TaxID=410072 RepID=UPI003F8C675E